MDTVTGCFILLGIFGSITCALVVLLFNVVGQISSVNKQLLISLTGRDGKPETLRALVASSKPPQGKLKGIATGSGEKKKKDEKSKNTDYVLAVGEG